MGRGKNSRWRRLKGAFQQQGQRTKKEKPVKVETVVCQRETKTGLVDQLCEPTGVLCVCPSLVATGLWDLVHKSSGYSIVVNDYEKDRLVVLGHQLNGCGIHWTSISCLGRGMSQGDEERCLRMVSAYRKAKTEHTTKGVSV